MGIRIGLIVGNRIGSAVGGLFETGVLIQEIEDVFLGTLKHHMIDMDIRHRWLHACNAINKIQ